MRCTRGLSLLLLLAVAGFVANLSPVRAAVVPPTEAQDAPHETGEESCRRLTWLDEGALPDQVLKRLGFSRAIWFFNSSIGRWLKYGLDNFGQVLPGSVLTAIVHGAELFLPDRICTVTANADPADGSGGYVEITGGHKIRDGQMAFKYESVARIHARSNPGWRFVGWVDDPNESDAVRLITMRSHVMIEAVWEQEIPFPREDKIVGPCTHPVQEPWQVHCGRSGVARFG